jgi:hypothetical protein
MTDHVNHPQHYNQGGPIGKDGTAEYEVIKIIDDLGWGFQFCMGNALKYVLRAPHKGTEKQDLEKARWYLRRALAYPERMMQAPVARRLSIMKASKAWSLKPELTTVVEAISEGAPEKALTFIAYYEAGT